MKQYVFGFTEKVSGHVKIQSEMKPTEAEIIEAISSGMAHYYNTEHEDIKLLEVENLPTKKKSERGEAR